MVVLVGVGPFHNHVAVDLIPLAVAAVVVAAAALIELLAAADCSVDCSCCLHQIPS